MYSTLRSCHFRPAKRVVAQAAALHYSLLAAGVLFKLGEYGTF